MEGLIDWLNDVLKLVALAGGVQEDLLLAILISIDASHHSVHQQLELEGGTLLAVAGADDSHCGDALGVALGLHRVDNVASSIRQHRGSHIFGSSSKRNNYTRDVRMSGEDGVDGSLISHVSLNDEQILVHQRLFRLVSTRPRRDEHLGWISGQHHNLVVSLQSLVNTLSASLTSTTEDCDLRH